VWSPEDRPRRAVLNLFEEWCNVVPVLADPGLQSVVLFYQTGNFALTMLGHTLLLVKRVAELLVLALQTS
jgi:hypothetical protein